MEDFPDEIASASLRTVAEQIAARLLRPSGEPGTADRLERISLTSAHGSSAALLCVELLKFAPRPLVLIAPSAESANHAADDLLALAPEARVRLLSAPENNPYEGIRADRTLSLERTATLAALSAGRLDVLVTSAKGWARKSVPLKVLTDCTRKLRVGDPFDLATVSASLDRSGYQRVPLVEDAGTFTARGDIFDVWPPGTPFPTRVTLEFDKIMELRAYDPETQVRHGDSHPPFSELFIPPAREAIVTEESEARARSLVRSLCDEINWPSSKTSALCDDVASGHLFLGGDAYLPALFPLSGLGAELPRGCVVLLDDPARIDEATDKERERVQIAYAHKRKEPHFPPDAHYLSPAELEASLGNAHTLSLHRGPLTEAPLDIPRLAPAKGEVLRLSALSTSLLRQALTSAPQAETSFLSALLERIVAWQADGARVIISTRTSAARERLSTLLRHRDVLVRHVDSLVLAVNSATLLNEAELYLVVSPLSQGIVAPLDSLVLLTELEVFGKRKPPRKKPTSAAIRDALDDLRSLSPGDFVVHVDHGIGRYLGLIHQMVGDHAVDLISVEYANQDKLLLPVYRLNQIQKFSGEGSPRLDRLGGQTFSKAKKSVRAKVRLLADQLLKLFAERKAAVRPPISIDEEEYAAFEATFPYEETPDQAAAISDVLTDLTQASVMDRLVCGDVGFGKTEVALRAAFVCAHAGRQVALLCPTTVLAEQHRRTFEERFSESGIVVRGLSRFVSKKNTEETLGALKTGQVDVVIGTHRLLSKDVHFKNLGLLIVDEEQRFGVAHKDRLKELKKSVDVLTLTATPIPRTLSLAVGGLRDMSIISTPPQDRRSIRTLTSRFDPALIKTAISRELERGGQVFYVYNRVDGIYERAALLRELLPEARIGVGHGQMNERELEKTMLGFVQGEFDVLCATSIVESGLDIPNANTIIIDRADLFGVSQLYQIRGRVGRSAERAYCYLLLPADVRLSDEARSRIEALERFTELGSGFHVAKMDLELRGAGEFLGADQSGFMARVGFELFLDMLNQATLELSGEEVISDVDPEVSVDVEALLPETYVEDIGLRLSLYKRFAAARDERDVAALSEELEDRFGSPPPETRRFCELMVLKTELRALRALGLSASGSSATVHLQKDSTLSLAKLIAKISQSKGLYSLSPDGKLKRTPRTPEANGLVHGQRMLAELRSFGLETPQSD